MVPPGTLASAVCVAASRLIGASAFSASGLASAAQRDKPKMASVGAAALLSALSSAEGSYGNRGRWLVGANGSYGGKQFTTSLNAGFREV